jgi:hypothetical protein
MSLIDIPEGFMFSWELLYWAMANLNIIKPQEDLTEDDIRRAIRWIGDCSYDTIYIDGDKPRIGRHGIGLMLSVTLMEFPEYYVRYELWQLN